MYLQTETTSQDKALLRRVQNGDRRAFNELFERHYKLTYTLSYRLLHSKTSAQEVVQDVFLKIWLKRTELSDIENFGAYINRTTRNLSIDALRKIARETLKWVELKEDQLNERNTEDTIQYHESAEMLRTAINTLPPQQKLVYQLCHEQGLKYEEAAQQLGISPGTVHTHMKQALKNIRIYFKNMDAMLLILLLLNK